VNIRLTPGDFQVLEAAAFVHQLTPASLLTDIAEEALSRMQREPAVETALRARSEGVAAGEAVVSPIEVGRTFRRAKE